MTAAAAFLITSAREQDTKAALHDLAQYFLDPDRTRFVSLVEGVDESVEALAIISVNLGVTGHIRDFALAM